MASGDVRDYGEGEALTFPILLGRGDVIDGLGTWGTGFNKRELCDLCARCCLEDEH